MKKQIFLQKLIILLPVTLSIAGGFGAVSLLWAQPAAPISSVTHTDSVRVTLYDTPALSGRLSMAGSTGAPWNSY